VVPWFGLLPTDARSTRAVCLVTAARRQDQGRQGYGRMHERQQRCRPGERGCEIYLRPHPEERALARVSKDGRESMRCVHPSRRLLRKLLRMRSVFFTTSNAGIIRRALSFGRIVQDLPSNERRWLRVPCFRNDVDRFRIRLRPRGAKRPRRCFYFPPQRGRGECRAHDAPAVPCAFGSGK